MMLRRCVSTSLLVILASSTGCQLVTDFSEDSVSDVAGKANAGTGGRAAGTSNRSGAGGTGANAQPATTNGGAATGQGGSGPDLTTSVATNGGASGATDLTVTGGVVGNGGSSATLEVPASTTAVTNGGTGGTGGTSATAVTPTAGNTQASASGGATNTTSVAGTSASSCTIDGIAYPADTKKGDNGCLSCRPDVSHTAWSIAANGTTCGTGTVCNAGSCQSGCWIASKFIAEGTVNPENPCLGCKSSASPTDWSDVPSRTCVQSISAGTSHSCAIVDGSIYCWGYNDLGQLGIGTTSTSYVPVRKAFAQYSKAISCGGSNSCAIRDGHIYCWGDNTLGQLGYGERGGASNTYMEVIGLDVGSNLVAVGRDFGCAVRDASPVCWGYNDYGELGDGSNTARPSAGGVRGPIGGVTAIAAGDFHACVIANGGVKCWGNNLYGRLGVTGVTSSNVPVQVASLTSGVTAISAGDDNTCAVVNGAAKCWGSNNHGKLGNGSTTNMSSSPVQVTGLQSGVSAVTVGGEFACAIVNGGVRCWGYNDEGQLGNNSTVESSTPVPVQVLSAGVTAIEAGWAHVCAIANGQAYCWGMNNNGRLGIGDGVTESLVPAKLTFDYNNAS